MVLHHPHRAPSQNSSLRTASNLPPSSRMKRPTLGVERKNTMPLQMQSTSTTGGQSPSPNGSLINSHAAYMGCEPPVLAYSLPILTVSQWSPHYRLIKTVGCNYQWFWLWFMNHHGRLPWPAHHCGSSSSLLASLRRGGVTSPRTGSFSWAKQMMINHYWSTMIMMV